MFKIWHPIEITITVAISTGIWMTPLEEFWILSLGTYVFYKKLNNLATMISFRFSFRFWKEILKKKIGNKNVEVGFERKWKHTFLISASHCSVFFNVLERTCLECNFQTTPQNLENLKIKLKRSVKLDTVLKRCCINKCSLIGRIS